MKKQLLNVGLCVVAVFLTGAVTVSTVDKFLIEPETTVISSWSDLYRAYNEKSFSPPLPDTEPLTVFDMIQAGNWGFMSDIKWFYEESGGTYYVSENSKELQGLDLPLTIRIYDYLPTGEVYILSSKDSVKFKSEAAFKSGELTGPEFAKMTFSEQGSRLLMSLWKKRCVWEITLKDESEKVKDMIKAEEAASLLSSGKNGSAPMMMRSSAPEAYTNTLWLWLAPQGEGGLQLQVFAPGTISNVEVYICGNLVPGVWTIAVQNLHPAGPTNPAVWDATGYEVFFLACGNMDSDEDGDGLPTAREQLVTKTLVNNSDTDGDGLSDGTEIQTYGTNPLSGDTDNDGLPDGWEVQYGLDPLDASGSNGGTGDFDSDGVSNYTEYQRGINPADEHSVTRETGIWHPFVVDAYSLARSSNILFVAGNGLFAFDISDPQSPECLSATNLSVCSYPKLAANGSYVYACESRETGLHLFDYSNPSAPQYAGQITLPAGKPDNYWGFNNLLVQDGYLYVWDNAVDIYSLTNPAVPQWIGSIPDISTETNNLDVCGLYVNGDLLYAGYRDGGFSVWDVTDRTAPELQKQLLSTNSAIEFTRQGDFLYVVECGFIQTDEWYEEYARMTVLDAPGGIPTNDVPLTVVNYDGSYYFPPRGLIADQQTVYVADDQWLRVFDAANPSAPQSVYQESIGRTSQDIELYNSTLYLATGGSGLTILDVTNPAAPAIVNTIGVGGSTLDIAGGGDTLYVCHSSGAVMEFDASNASGLTQVTEFPAANGSGVYITDDLAYVAMGYNGMSIYDLSASNQPNRIAEIDAALPLDFITVQGDYAYCGSRSGQALVTLDCSDSENLQEVYTNSSLGYIDRLMMAGDLLYAASFDKGLLVFSLTNAAQPALMGQLNTRGCFRDMCVSSNLVYAADGVNGLLVIDVTDPAQPVQIGQLKLEYGRRLALSGDRICMLGYKTIYFIDVSDPLQPVLQQEISFGTVEPIAVCATSGLFHVLDKNNQLHTYFIP